MKPIGKVTHYYDKIGVAIVDLANTLKVGDRIKIEHGDNAFEQEVSSMHKDYKPVQNADKGETIGLKVEQETHSGAMVFLFD
jgi:translation elongation factor EF-1alpha